MFFYQQMTFDSCMKSIIFKLFKFSKQSSKGVLLKVCPANMQKVYRKVSMQKFSIKLQNNFVEIRHTSVWMFSCKVAVYLQNTFCLWGTTSKVLIRKIESYSFLAEILVIVLNILVSHNPPNQTLMLVMPLLSNFLSAEVAPPQVFLGKGVLKYAANLQENTHAIAILYQCIY